MSTTGRTVIGFAFGRQALEHDLSVKSALYLMAHLDRRKYDCVTLYVDPAGRFASYDHSVSKLRGIIDYSEVPIFAPTDEVPEDFNEWLGETVPGADGGLSGTDLLVSGKIDIVFPVFHGQRGEDSIFQGMLEFLQVPYVGCGVMGSAVGNDKEIAKRICMSHGIRVADFRSIKSDRWSESPYEFISEVEEVFGYPVFVKPPCLGSSVGISKAYDRGQFLSAMDEVHRFGEKALVEKPVDGREYGVGLIGNWDLEAGAIVEFGQGPDYLDYEAKYGPSACEDTIPADIGRGMADRLIWAAKIVYRALDLCGMSRIDFFISGEDVILNEVNTVPGFGKNSVFSKMYEAAGVALPELIDRLVGFGLERGGSRNNLTFELSGAVDRM